MGTAILRRALSKNKGKERIIFHVNGAFFITQRKGRTTQAHFFQIFACFAKKLCAICGYYF